MPSTLVLNFDLNVIWYSKSFPGSILQSNNPGGWIKQSLPSYLIAYSKTLFVGFVKVIAFITLSPKIQENWNEQ